MYKNGLRFNTEQSTQRRKDMDGMRVVKVVRLKALLKTLREQQEETPWKRRAS